MRNTPLAAVALSVVAVALAVVATPLAVVTTPPAVVTTPLVIQAPVYNESANWEYQFAVEDLGWPERGCETDEDSWRHLTLRCSLAGAHVTLSTDPAASYLTLTCETEGNRSSTVSCEELEAGAGEALRSYAAAALAAGGGARSLDRLELVQCAPAGPLACLPRLLAAADTAALYLRGVRAPLLPDRLRGLDAVTRLRMRDVDANVTQLPYAALAALPALRRLDVWGGALRLEAGGAPWRPLRRLLMLELALGELRALPARAFQPLDRLRNLSLWTNQIETVDENAFEGLSELEMLSLNGNRLRALPAGLLRPTPRLQLLHLVDNPITFLPDMGNLTNLEQLWLNNKNQSTLALRNDTFSGLTALRQLKLEACGLAELPAALLADQAALQALHLAYNRLRALPPALLRATRALEQLHLNNNRLEHLPDGAFVSLAALDTLNLSHNNLRHLQPAVFEGLSGIRELWLSHNELSLAAYDALGGGAPSPLAGLQSLTSLHLDHNRLAQFMDDWRDLRHLEALDLSYNDIEELSDVDLQLLSEAVVDVRHNKVSRVRQLSSVVLDMAGDEMSRARFLLDDNPFRCDCGLYGFLASLARPAIGTQFDLGSAVCAAPQPLAGQPVKTLPLESLLCPVPQCAPACSCTLRPANRQLEMECAREPRPLPPLPPDADSVRLRLRFPPADVALLPATVRWLDLSGLQLVAPPAASFAVLNLTVDLSENNLTSAPIALLEANSKVLLARNPLACDCEHRESVTALRRHWQLVRDGDALRCAGGGDGAEGELVHNKDPDALCAGRDALALGLGSGVAVALLVLLVFRFRTELRLILGRFKMFDFLLPGSDLGIHDKKYDAFVSFSHHDEAYVRDVLVPALEGGRRPLRLCLHYRDWEVGDFIPDQIDRSVRHSWRTIVVLSEDFMRSVWARHEFRAAHGLERVIVLVLGDALRAMDGDRELRKYKKTHTCIMASHPLVWDRIRDAVYRSKSAAAAASAPAPAPAATPAPALALAPGCKPAGGLDVQLRDGGLVNAAITADEPKKFPPIFDALPYINTRCTTGNG